MINFNSTPHTRNFFTTEDKLAMIQEYITTPVSMSEMTKKYHIGHETIPQWMRIFGIPMPKELPIQMPMSKTEVKQEGPATIESLEIQLKALKEELGRERLKNLALNTMIDLTEEKLNIEIRKKAGAKR